MTLKEVIEYWEQFNTEIDEMLDLYCSDVAHKKTLEEQREVVEFTIAALRGQRKEFMPPCYKPDSGDGECAYNPPSGRPRELIAAAPADVAEVRHGRWRWITYDANPKIGNWHCTCCNRIPKSFQKEDFCPNCGAKMDKEEV